MYKEEAGSAAFFVHTKRHSCMNARNSTVRPLSLAAPDVGLGLAALGVPDDSTRSDKGSLSITYISPVASELTNSRPWASKAMPTGLKQCWGQMELSMFQKMSVVAVLLSGAAIGSPFSNGITDSL